MSNKRTVELEELFDYSRAPTTLDLLSLLVYTPLGLLLFVIRFFIGLHVFLITLILPKNSYLRSLILRPFLAILGIIFVQENTHNIDPQCKVLVANYTTPLDHSVLHLCIPHHLVSVWDYSALVQWLLGSIDLGAKSGRETLVANAKEHCQSSNLPLLCFPECETTNGKVGLLKFSSWPLALEQQIQPITIKINRPFLPVPPSLINSFLLNDTFWVLFLPITIFRISFLPQQECTGDANEDSKRLQSLMAENLGVAATEYNSKDKLELIKKLDSRRNNGRGSNDEGSGTNLDPSNVADISTILKSSNASIHPKPSAHKPVFEKNSRDRHLSFQEKKALFIETARKRYLEKHS